MSALSPTSASSMSAEPSANAQSSAQQLAVGAVDGIDNSLTANSAEHDAAKDEKINHTSSNDFTSMPPPAPPALKPTKNNAVKGPFIDSEQTADTDFSSVPPFSWELYLAELNAAPVALQAFTHVGRAFRELVPKGNVVEVVWHREAINNDVNLPLEAATSGEVANISASQQEHVYFWYARVIISSAPLLLVNWLGSSENDVCSEFWVDCEEGNVHSVGWCGEFFQLTQQQPQHSVISDTHGLPRRYVSGKPAPKIINVNPISPTEESDAAAPTASDTVAAPAEPGPIIPPHTKYEMRMPPTVLSNLQAANSSGQPADTSKMIDNYRAEAWAAKTPNPEDIEEFYGIPPAERIVPGNYVDLLSEEEPTCAWPVKILDSAGGRLKLHYWPVGDERIEKQWPALRDGKTPQQFVEECEEDEFWVFCNSYLIRPLGSTGRYRIPDDLPECYRDLLRNLEGTWHAGLKELVERENQHKLPGDIFSYFEPDKNHTFQAGMRLESLNPINEKHIQPAYIGRVFDNGYVHLVYDDMEKYEWVEEDARERQRALRAGTAICKKCNKPMKAGECDASCAAMNARSDAIQKEMQAAGVCPSPPATRAPPGCSRQFGIDDTLEPVSPSVRGPPLHSSVTKASLRILTFQNSTRMLPPYWSERNGVKLSKPSKWSTTRHGEFSWPRMIDGFGGQLAPRGSFKFVEQLITNPGFSVGSKLEAVNPEAPDEICTATIVRVIPPMLWIHIDSYGQSLTYMTPFDSTDIFPCGFCSMHNVKLHLPRIMLHGRRSAFVRSVSNANLQTATVPASAGPSGKNDGSLSEIDMRVRKSEIVPRPIMWRDIPIITLYYNRGCSYGPFLIGKRMHTLHLQIGPGPLRYVLREFIRMLVNCHRSPPGALRMMAELGSAMNEPSSSAADSAATTPPNGTVMPLEAPVGKSSLRYEKIPLEMLYREKVLVKAKMKPRSETRAVPIVSQVWLVPDFVRQICILFQACPSLYTVDKRPPDTECKESCDTFVKPNPRAAAYRRTARRTAGVGGGASTANLSTALTASNSSINNSSAVNKRAQRIDFASKSLQNAVGDDIAVDADADEDVDANAEAASSQQEQQVPEAPTTRSTRNRAKVSYQLMDKGISGDARRQKFEDSYRNANTRPQPKDGANTTPSKRKRRIDDEENEADTSHEDEEEDRARNDADDMDYDQSVVDAENDDDVDENSMTISDVPDDNSEGAAGGKGKKRRSNFTKPKRGGNGRIQKKISSDLTQKSSGKLNFLSPKTPIGTPTNIAELQQQRKQRGGKRQKSGRAALTLAERNDRMFLRELSALASNNQQLPLSQRRRVAEAAAAAGKTFRSTISQVGAGQYYDDNRAQAWMEFWSQCDYLDKVYVDKVRAKDPRMWTSEDIELFLVPNYGKQVSDIFTSDGIDGSLLMRLDMLGLRTLRVPSNIVPELMLEIEKLKVAFMYCHGDELTPDEWTTLTEHCGGHGYED